MSAPSRSGRPASLWRLPDQACLEQVEAGNVMAAASGSPPFRCYAEGGGNASLATLRLFVFNENPNPVDLSVKSDFSASTQLAAIAASLDHSF